ncbi:MAG: GatB/YqeY domain-containing protein [Candidatus Liptonbacteria bacterium]|nr:GatB/YqeY domain-containing protein [Candidatus Liptonbacteria bacterium]
MEGLKEKLTQDLKEAMKAGMKEKTDVVRFLLAQIQNREIEKRSTGQAPTLTGEEVVETLQKEVKKRREAIELFKKGGRPELVQKEELELALITGYLPPEMSREELEKIIGDLKNQGFNDFNSLMKEAMKKVKGKADGKLVSEIVKEKL